VRENCSRVCGQNHFTEQTVNCSAQQDTTGPPKKEVLMLSSGTQLQQSFAPGVCISQSPSSTSFSLSPSSLRYTIGAVNRFWVTTGPAATWSSSRRLVPRFFLLFVGMGGRHSLCRLPFDFTTLVGLRTSRRNSPAARAGRLLRAYPPRKLFLRILAGRVPAHPRQWFLAAQLLLYQTSQRSALGLTIGSPCVQPNAL
jgi:hypothetical protein